MYTRKKRAISILVIAILAISFVLPFASVYAQVTVTAATGGEAISADTFGGYWTTLTGPVITESTAGDISTGTIIIWIPAGFEVNTAQDVTATVTGDIGLASTTATPTASTITFTVSTVSSTPSTITFSDIQVRPTTGTLPNTGEITNEGTTQPSVPGFGYGVLTMVPGVLDHFTMTGYPATCLAGVAWTNPVVVMAHDAYDNLKTDYTGTVTFTSTDPLAELPIPYALAAGQRTYAGSLFTLNTFCSHTITVADGLISLESDPINVQGIMLDSDIYNIGDAVTVTVKNTAANGDPMAIEEITVEAISTTDLTGDQEITLTETSYDTGVFVGSFTLIGAPPADRDANEIVVGVGDTITVTYPDEGWTAIASVSADTGILSITTTPVSGEVFVDTVSWGYAPAPQVVGVGSYTVSFGAVADYITPAPQVVDVTTGITTTVTGTYVAIIGPTGTLSITTTPVTGEVFVDTVSWGDAPASQVVAIGPHTVSFGNVPLFDTPADQAVVVALDTTKNVQGTYVLSAPPTDPFTIDYVTPGDVEYDDVLIVMGSGVTAGSEVKVFWDYAYGTYAHHLNTTEGNPDGTFDCTVTVPSDVFGIHYLWVTDVASKATVKSDPISMVSKIKLSPSSGLVGDPITVKGYGYEDESDVTIKFATTVLTTTVETDELGYFEYEFDVPTGTIYGTYTVTATDSDSPVNTASLTFTVGASITLTPEEGPTGSVVSVSGRGWTVGNTITFYVRKGSKYDPVEVRNQAVVTVGSGGKFSTDVVIPDKGLGIGDCYIEAVEAGILPKDPSSDEFEVTGIPEIVVSPTYGSPGATITVTGSNFTQISGTEVVIELRTKGGGFVADLVTAETRSDGTFEDKFMSPAVLFIGYDVYAVDTIYHIDAKDAFKVGLIALIINPTYGEAGTMTSITGIGFAPGDYNVTFGTQLYEDYNTVSGGGAISNPFYVPNVEPGTYDLTVIDEDENELTAQFTVTAATEVILDPAMAPNGYNMTIKGYNFADYEDTVDFVLFNATEKWDMDVWQTYDTPYADYKIPVETGDDGNFTAWWEVFPEEDLSLGDYTINVTGYDDFLVQLNFSVVEARVDVAPRKALFDRGDTIQFNVKNDFDFKKSYMKIWDPYENLYWRTELFADWVKAAGLYTVPYYLQTSGMNPMTLSQDAPIGTWFYVFYEEGTTQLVNGTFEVGPSAAAQVDEKLTELWGSIEDLTSNIDDITSEIGDDIDALSGEIDDVVADVQNMVDDITADLAEELAGVAADTEAAVGELEGAIGDIASAQNDLASELDDMSQDTAAAKQAAEDSQQTAQGLSTLVYGAIAASLIAALAAVVSLMQISKKIA